MQTTSDLYKQLLAQVGHSFQIQLLVGPQGSETTIHMDNIFSMHRSGSFAEEGGLTVGGCPAQRLDLVLVGVQNTTIPKMGRLRPQIRVVGSDGSTVSEWIDLGVFYVDTRIVEAAYGYIQITAYDAMLKGDSLIASEVYSGRLSVIPSQMISDLASSIGVTSAAPFQPVLDIFGTSFAGRNEQRGSVRDAISRFAAALMSNAFVSAAGDLCFVRAGVGTEDAALATIDTDRVSNLGTNLPGVTRVEVEDSRVEENGQVWRREYGSSSGTTVYAQGICVPKYSASKAYEYIAGKIYRPRAAEDVELDPALELGDIVETGSNGEMWMICSLEVDYGRLVVGTAAAPAPSELAHEFPVKSQAEVSAEQALRESSAALDALDDKLDVDGTARKAISIPFAQVDSTSTSTAYTATVDGIAELRSGVAVYLTNGVVTSASGWTLDINGLGAKPVYQSQAAATRTTTIFNINYTMLFIFNEDRVEGGCWDIFYGYNSDTDTLAYNIRRGNGSYLVHTALNRYMVSFTKDEATILPVTATGNSTGTGKTLTSLAWDPFGPIYYYATTTVVAAGEAVGSGYLYTQYSSCDLRYAFNTGKTLTPNRDVFLVCVPQSNGKVKLNSSPISQSLPTTEDGLVYIRLGHAYSAYQTTLDAQHPAYQFKAGRLQLYTGAA